MAPQNNLSFNSCALVVIKRAIVCNISCASGCSARGFTETKLSFVLYQSPAIDFPFLTLSSSEINCDWPTRQLGRLRLPSMSEDIETPPNWAGGLTRHGMYYEGYVDNLLETLNKHTAATVTTYGVRRSRIANHSNEDKENEVY